MRYFFLLAVLLCSSLPRAVADTPFELLEQADQSIMLGDFPAALRDYQQIVESSPSPTILMRANIGAARALRGLGRHAEAVDASRAVVRQLWHTDRASPWIGAANALLASAYRLNGQYALALRTANEARAQLEAAHWEMHPEYTELLLTQAWLARTFGQLHLAWQLVQRVCPENADSSSIESDESERAAPVDPLIAAQCILLRVAIGQAAAQSAQQPWFVRSLLMTQSPEALLTAAAQQADAISPPHPVSLALHLEWAAVAIAQHDPATAAQQLAQVRAVVQQLPWLAEHPWMIRYQLLDLQLRSAALAAGAPEDVTLLGERYAGLVADAVARVGAKHPSMVTIHSAYARWLAQCAQLPALRERERLQCANQQVHAEQRADHLRQLIIQYNPWPE